MPALPTRLPLATPLPFAFRRLRIVFVPSPFPLRPIFHFQEPRVILNPLPQFTHPPVIAHARFDPARV